MPTVIQTGFGPIILAVKARLVEELEIDETMVKIVARNFTAIPRFNGDRDILLRTLNMQARQEIYSGAGRTCLRIRRWFDACVRLRSYLDESQSDESWLTDETGLGFLTFEEEVQTTICGFYPTDEDGNHLTVEEIRLFDGEMGDKDQVAREWGGAAHRYEVEYLLLKNAAPISTEG